MKNDGLRDLISTFFEMVKEEKNPWIRSYYWKIYNHLFRCYFGDGINYIIKR
jgi:hypothetical protein